MIKDDFKFNSFYFISPVINVSETVIQEEAYIDLISHHDSDVVNYGYIIAIVVTMALILECKKLILKFLAGYSLKEEREYVTLELNEECKN